MKALTHLCLAALAVVLASCGCGSGKSAKTKGMTFEELTAKLESLKSPHETECTTCGGKKIVVDEERGDRLKCKTCEGTGILKMQRGASTEDWNEKIGLPDKREDKPGDLIWEYWYYRVEEGTARVHAFLSEERGDVERVTTGQVDLLK